MLPEDIAHERRRSGQKILLAHGAHVAASHAKVLQHHTFQRELFDGPVEPARDVALWPQSRIWIFNKTIHKIKKSVSKKQTIVVVVTRHTWHWRHLLRPLYANTERDKFKQKKGEPQTLCVVVGSSSTTESKEQLPHGFLLDDGSAVCPPSPAPPLFSY